MNEEEKKAKDAFEAKLSLNLTNRKPPVEVEKVTEENKSEEKKSEEKSEAKSDRKSEKDSVSESEKSEGRKEMKKEKKPSRKSTKLDPGIADLVTTIKERIKEYAKANDIRTKKKARLLRDEFRDNVETKINPGRYFSGPVEYRYFFDSVFDAIY